jgi:hypothetical protein
MLPEARLADQYLMTNLRLLSDILELASMLKNYNLDIKTVETIRAKTSGQLIAFTI